MNRFFTTPLVFVAILAAFGSFGCDDTRDYSFLVEFPDDTLRDEATLVLTRIQRDNCDGTVLFEQSFRRDDAPSMDVTTLAPGPYAFVAVARNADCEPIGRVCRLLQMPEDESTISVTLERTTPGTPGCAPSVCVDGECNGTPVVDSGVDAVSDGALDGGNDAGDSGGGDTSVPDSGPALPAPTIISPWTGVATGSANASLGADGPSNHPLLPEVRWTEVTGAVSYVLEMVRCDETDISVCDLSAATTRVIIDAPPLRARPPSPLAVSDTAPVGARYAFRVGACAEAAGRTCNYADARYIDVGRIAEDTDGDGDGDFYAVTETGAGVTAIKQITGFGSGATADVPLAIPDIRGMYWVGDYDADGVGELAISTSGAPGGRVIFVDNLAEAGSVEESTAGANLGERIAALGDTNGDGYADFAMTVPGDEVRIQFGGPTWNASNGVVIRPSPGLSFFGADIAAVGDRNRDGLPDIGIVSRLSMDQARIEIFSIASGAPRRVEMQDVGTGEIAMGGPIAPPIVISGGIDVDADGYPDIGVGRPEVNSMMILFDGSRRDGTNPPRTARFGASIAGGDIDGTGRGRFVVGDPNLRSTVGGDEAGQLTVVAYNGSPFNLLVVPYFANDPVRLGTEVSVVDLNGDGLEDFFTVAEDGFIIDRLSFDPVMGGIQGSRFLFATGGISWKTITR